MIALMLFLCITQGKRRREECAAGGRFFFFYAVDCRRFSTEEASLIMTWCDSPISLSVVKQNRPRHSNLAVCRTTLNLEQPPGSASRVMCFLNLKHKAFEEAHKTEQKGK